MVNLFINSSLIILFCIGITKKIPKQNFYKILNQ